MSSAKRKYFGTDGIRGVANSHPMTPEFVMRLGQAAAKVLALEAEKAGIRPKCIVGRDTRLSGDMIESALTAGLTSMGVDVVLCGVVPTPAVALAFANQAGSLVHHSRLVVRCVDRPFVGVAVNIIELMNACRGVKRQGRGDVRTTVSCRESMIDQRRQRAVNFMRSPSKRTRGRRQVRARA